MFERLFQQNRFRARAASSSSNVRISGRPEDAESLPLVQPAAEPRNFARYLFICGLHRSGTTLVEQWLQARTRVCHIEAPVPENEGQHLQDVYPIALHHGGPGRFGFAADMYRDPPVGEEAAAARKRLLACWTPWIVGEGDVLLEKSPPNLIRIDWLRAVFPGARFVIMTRHPLAVAAATRKWAGTSIAELVYHWDVVHQAALADERGDCLRLRYEDFCDDPETWLERIAAFAGLELQEGAIEDERFRVPADTNARYLDPLPRQVYGRGSWGAFDYAL